MEAAVTKDVTHFAVIILVLLLNYIQMIYRCVMIDDISAWCNMVVAESR
jgi:hypothetical protein